MQIKQSLILQLYKNLFKYGQQLKYTDKSYYLNYIRKQFQSVDIEDTKKIEILYKVRRLKVELDKVKIKTKLYKLKKGQSFLEQKRVI